ncbi:helix-turn-helix domain-containing protein [Leptospira ellisii]|uniref:Helix-turn-helix domain-containing protein n=1 Tax=Leptospira ellisii TaxID=2023197 RepID=A0AAE4QR65_9LEPT|nr:helix-turn-helix domain-containing protein [Leptospira ellisii]MDV6237598.1 helix-turn-helix domain-containing protein [Leptospira ellisii]
MSAPQKRKTNVGNACEEEIYLPIPKKFSREKRIKKSQFSNALLVLGAIRSFAGRGGVCFAPIGFGPDDEENPKVKKATLCSRSGLTKNTVVKYKKLLFELGWIHVKREGGKLNDTIRVFWSAQIFEKDTNTNVCDSSDKNDENNTDLGVINPNVNEGDSTIPAVSVGPEVQYPINKNVHILGEAQTIDIGTNTTEIENTWKDFLKWCERSRISFNTQNNLRSLKVSFDENKIQIASVTTRSAQNLIKKYFTENLRGKYSPWFYGGIIEDSQFRSDSLFEETRPKSAFKAKREEPTLVSEDELSSFIEQLEKFKKGAA